MLKAWRINLKKMKIINWVSLLGLITVFLTMTAFMQPNIKDNAHIIEPQTKILIENKNNRYLQNKEQPQIVVITVRRLNKLTPKILNDSKKRAFIVVGQKGKKRNVQIFSSKDLHSAFTAESRMNIIRAAEKDLRAKNNKAFNRGLRFVFRACATKIDQQYKYALDKYDLNNKEQDKVNHPRRIALPIAFAIVFLVIILMYFFRQIRNRNNMRK